MTKKTTFAGPLRRALLKGPNLDPTEADLAIISAIANRAMRVAKAARRRAGMSPPTFDALDINMDIAATHLNGCPLRLMELLDANAFNFTHDVFGIRRHLNRKTGKLENRFLPRYARGGDYSP